MTNLFLVIGTSNDNKRTWSKQISDKAAHYPILSRFFDLESEHGDPDHLKSLINCYLYHCRGILKMSSKSAYNILSNSLISDWAVSMLIWIAMKI